MHLIIMLIIKTLHFEEEAMNYAGIIFWLS
jgi:hypothetical protein